MPDLDDEPAEDDPAVDALLDASSFGSEQARAVRDSGIKHPDVTVHLSTGCDDNIGAIMARITQGLRRAGYASEQDAFREEIFAADSYDHALRICMRWVHVT